MSTLKQYRVHYLIDGRPDSLRLASFTEPDLERIELEILLKHVREPRASTDQPWEDPIVPSEQGRLAELGVSDIRVELEH